MSTHCAKLAGAAAILVVAAGHAASQEVKDINVAVIIPMSGPVMVNVDPAVKSIRMALEEVNAKGIMIGGQRHQLKLEWLDEECKPPVAINAARAVVAKLASYHLLWTPMCSSSAVAVSPILQEAKALSINPVSGTSRFVGPKGDPYLFKTKEEFDWRTRDLVKYFKKRNYQSIVTVAVNSDWGEESVRILKRYADAEGLKVVAALNYDEHTEEFAPLLVQARAANPDVIFQASQLLNEQIAFLRSYRQLGLKIPLAGESTWTEDVPAKSGWEAIDGMVTASAWVPTDPRPQVQQYIRKYRDKFGAIPGFNGPPSYDVVYLTAQVAEKAGSLDKEAMRQVLRTTTFGDLVYGGGSVKFDPNGQADFPVTVTVFDAKQRLRVPVN
jgi:branched-chain amino acid transport system substrate-binding protein